MDLCKGSLVCAAVPISHSARSRFDKFEVVEVKSELTDVGADLGDGVGVGGGRGGGAGVARAPDVGVVPGHLVGGGAGLLHDVAAHPDAVAAGGDAGAAPVEALLGGVALPRHAVAAHARLVREVDDGQQRELPPLSCKQSGGYLYDSSFHYGRIT